MKSNRLLFSVLYGLGVVLAVSLFLAFVPEESRTSVKWMNLLIGLFIYSAFWGKFLLLYPHQREFGDNVPLFSAYWMSLGWYAAAAVVAMVLFWTFGVGFEKQAILQGVLLFGFVVSVCVGMGASNFMRGESERIREQVGGIREVQSASNRMKVRLSALPAAYGFVRREFDAFAEEATYVGGSNSPEAGKIERQMQGLLERLETQCSVPASPDECLATVKALQTALSMRKTVTNV